MLSPNNIHFLLEELQNQQWICSQTISTQKPNLFSEFSLPQILQQNFTEVNQNTEIMYFPTIKCSDWNSIHNL
jgi:hypothetical protein